MDVRDEMSLSKDDPSPKSSSLRVSDQNKHRNKLIGVKDKPQVGSLSPRKWRTRDMIVAAKHGDNVLNVQPVSEFNPTTGIQVLKPLVKKPLVVRDKVKDKASVKKPADVVEKPEKVKDKATIKKPADVVEKPITVVVKDKVTVKKLAVVATVKKPANVVEKPAILTELPKLNASADVADKESDVVNNKDKESDVADKESDVVDKESDVDKDKFGANELLSDVVSKKRRRRTELPKPALKPAVKGNESKKLKSKSGMKIKMKNSSDSLSSFVDEKELRRILKKLKNIKQEDSDGIGFNLFHNLAIDEIPSRVGRFCVSNFNSFTYKLSLDFGDSIHVTPSKIHDILGILMGGISLFSLEARPVEHEFVQSWVDQFYPKPLKKIQVGDIASKLIFAHEVDFLFKVNFLTLFTNTTGRVAGLKGEICLDVLLYFDSTKFDGVPVVRTRPAIRAWNSTLMRQREKLELKEHVLGLLELHDESTGGGSMVTSEKENLIKKAKEKLSIVCSERVFLEGCLMTASEKYPGDRKFFDIHQKYAEVFKNPIEFGYHESSLGDDRNGDDDTGNGDDDTGNGDDDDRNGDDDAGVDDDVNEGDYNNVDGNDSSVTDKEVRVEDDGKRVVDGNGDGQNDNRGSKKQVESTEKQSVDPTDPTEEENGDALDAINLDIGRMEESDAGPVTPERLATRVSKLSPSPEKQMVKPSSYLLSPYMNKTTKTLSMFDGTYATDEERWENFSAQVSAQFKDNVNGLALNGIDLAFFPICLSGHFYVVVFNLTKTTSMTILDNSDSGATYDSKYKQACDLLAKILKMKWKTETNFRDCGIFTMLHMESYSGQTASTWDCGLVSESKLQCDMVRRLRFKFATKIPLHEINVHAPKMLELAKEFDKLDSREKLSIVVEAAKNKGERERS
ncbi:integrase, catalytic region, zinc finger, CCHC-type containing protein [Tanacetum coccineum]